MVEALAAENQAALKRVAKLELGVCVFVCVCVCVCV
jgi:hypothetical protein